MLADWDLGFLFSVCVHYYGSEIYGSFGSIRKSAGIDTKLFLLKGLCREWSVASSCI